MPTRTEAPIDAGAITLRSVFVRTAILFAEPLYEHCEAFPGCSGPRPPCRYCRAVRSRRARRISNTFKVTVCTTPDAQSSTQADGVEVVPPVARLALCCLRRGRVARRASACPQSQIAAWRAPEVEVRLRYSAVCHSAICCLPRPKASSALIAGSATRPCTESRATLEVFLRARRVLRGGSFPLSQTADWRMLSSELRSPTSPFVGSPFTDLPVCPDPRRHLHS